MIVQHFLSYILKVEYAQNKHRTCKSITTISVSRGPDCRNRLLLLLGSINTVDHTERDLKNCTKAEAYEDAQA